MSFNGVYIFHLSIGVNEAAEQTIIPSSWRPIHAFDAVSYSRSFILYIKLKFPHQKPSSTRPSFTLHRDSNNIRHFSQLAHGQVAPEERRGLPALALLKVRKQSIFPDRHWSPIARHHPSSRNCTSGRATAGARSSHCEEGFGSSGKWCLQALLSVNPRCCAGEYISLDRAS